MNSKSKGSGFERKVCRMLTKWMTGFEDPVICWRSSNSGGTFTVNRKKNAAQKTMAGDICSIDEKSKWFFDKYSVEVKCGYPGSNPLKLFKNSKNDEIRLFWEQANKDANESNKEPILIFKPNLGKTLIGFSENFYNEISVVNPIPTPNISIHFDEQYKLPRLILCRAEDFFEDFPIVFFMEVNPNVGVID